MSGAALTATVTLADRDNVLTAEATGPDGPVAATVGVFYPFLALTTFQVADAVIGQPDLVHVTPDARGVLGAAGVSQRVGSGGLGRRAPEIRRA